MGLGSLPDWQLEMVGQKMKGRQRFLWKAVDAAGEVLDFCVTDEPDEHLTTPFTSIHGAIYNTFNTQRHLISRNTMRRFRESAMAEWNAASAAAR